MEGDVRVLVGGRGGGVGVVHLGARQVGVGDVQRAADHERLAGVALGVLGVPRAQHLQRVGVQPADHDVARILVGGVHRPQAQLVRHQVDVGEAAPRVRVDVVKARRLQGALCGHAAGLKAVAHHDVALDLVVVQRAVVHHVVGARPLEGQSVRPRLHARHKVVHGLELLDEAVVGVAVHVPHLGGRGGGGRRD